MQMTGSIWVLSCIYDEVHKQRVRIYFRLPRGTMDVYLFLQQILCANKISKRNLVTALPC